MKTKYQDFLKVSQVTGYLYDRIITFLYSI